MSENFAIFIFFLKHDTSFGHLWAQGDWKWVGSGSEMGRKWVGSGSEMECEESTSAGLWRPAIFLQINCHRIYTILLKIHLVKQNGSLF